MQRNIDSTPFSFRLQHFYPLPSSEKVPTHNRGDISADSWDQIPVGARFCAPVQTGPESHPASCTMGTGSFMGVRCGRGVTLTPHPLLVPRSKTEYSYTSLSLKGLRGL